MSWVSKLFGKGKERQSETEESTQTLSAQDEFTCGRCGATSQWGERYYQDRTPDSPFPEPWPGAGGWDGAEHHCRAFCPKCGALVAERQTQGFDWADGARSRLPDRMPSVGGPGGEWIFPFNPFRECLVPYRKNTLDIESFKQVCAAAAAKERSITAMSVPDLIRRLRESKGKMAGDVERELMSRGETAVPYLVEALRDPEVYLRWRTCYVLAEMRDKAIGARPALEIALRDTEEPVRTGAADALSRIGKPEPVKP